MARVVIAGAAACLLFGMQAGSVRGQQGERPNLAPIALGPPAQIVAVQQARRALSEPSEIDFEHVPLAAALTDLASRHHVRFDLDRPALADARVEPDTPLTLRAKGIMLQSALRLLFEPIGLTCLVRDGGLLVTTQGRAATMLSIAVYPVADLAIARQGDRPGQRSNYSDITDGVRDILAVHDEQVGGARFGFSSLARAQALVALENDEGHEQTAALLASLRQARDAQQGEKPNFDPILVIPASQRAARERIDRALAERLTLDADQRPLSLVVADLAERFEIHIWLDSEGLEERSLSPTTPITARLSGVTLDAALRQMLRRNELAHVPRDESLLITSASRVSNIAELRVYPVADLVPESPYRKGIPSYVDLINLIVVIVEPTTWPEVGGPAQGIVAIRAAQSLVVSQTATAHEQIARLLSQLRNVRDAQRADLTDLRPIVLDMPARGEAEAKLRQKLAEQTQCDFQERPLAAALAYFAGRHQIEINIDHDQISESGEETKTPVTLKTHGIMLRSALRLMLEPLGLAAVVRDGKLSVISLAEAESMYTTVIYPVGDLPAKPLQRFRGHDVGDLPFDEAMRSAIEASFRFRNRLSFSFVDVRAAQALVTAEIDEGQEKTAALLDSLRQARDAQRRPLPDLAAVEVVAAPQRAARQKIRKILGEKLRLDADTRPLEVVSDELAQRLTIDIQLDRPALDRAQIAASRPITLGGSEATFDEALHGWLDPLGLTYVLLDESLLITSAERAEELPELWVYPVADLVSGDRPEEDVYNALVEFLVTVGMPAISGDRSGPLRDIVPIRAAGVLVVSQPERVQRKIARLLAGMRQPADSRKSQP